jgi:hypothetical protein
MTGIARATGAALAPPPTPFQGFGRVDLSASLPLAGDRRGYRLQVIDGAFFEADGLEHTYNITVAASTNTSSPPMPLIVTLVWFDIPAFPGARYVLVNNLDLKVEMAGGGNAWLGNGGASNNASIPDYRNNVEKVGSWRTATQADIACCQARLPLTGEHVHAEQNALSCICAFVSLMHTTPGFDQGSRSR